MQAMLFLPLVLLLALFMLERRHSKLRAKRRSKFHANSVSQQCLFLGTKIAIRKLRK